MGSGRIFCNRENEAFPAEAFEDGPENTKIHVTGTSSHTVDSWPASKESGQWVISEAQVAPLPCNVDLDNP